MSSEIGTWSVCFVSGGSLGLVLSPKMEIFGVNLG